MDFKLVKCQSNKWRESLHEFHTITNIVIKKTNWRPIPLLNITRYEIAFGSIANRF